VSQPGTYRSDGGRWAKVSKGHLAHEPFCRACKKAGRTVKAVLVDHIVPHRGDMKLFWDPNNRQSLCSTCGNGDKQRLERTGRAQYRGCSEDGTPLDPDHPWLKQELDAVTHAGHTAEVNTRLVKVLQ
jgi:5-methylcytosine-specific restriction protein A